MESIEKSYIKAVRLFNINETDCAFETGFIPTQVRIDAQYFFGQTKVDPYEKVPHPAPRRQYVVTIKGKLQFKVTDGTTFVIEPGIILIAEDINGVGHTWELMDGEQWERFYIPLDLSSDNHFLIGDGFTVPVGS